MLNASSDDLTWSRELSRDDSTIELPSVPPLVKKMQDDVVPSIEATAARSVSRRVFASAPSG